MQKAKKGANAIRPLGPLQRQWTQRFSLRAARHAAVRANHAIPDIATLRTQKAPLVDPQFAKDLCFQMLLYRGFLIMLAHKRKFLRHLFLKRDRCALRRRVAYIRLPLKLRARIMRLCVVIL